MNTINNFNWTFCRTIKGVITLPMSNQPHALHSSDFEIAKINLKK